MAAAPVSPMMLPERETDLIRGLELRSEARDLAPASPILLWLSSIASRATYCYCQRRDKRIALIREERQEKRRGDKRRGEETRQEKRRGEERRGEERQEKERRERNRDLWLLL
jgi:hypothetical protein